MNSYLVSVIIPNYCHAQYLDQRIESVLNQTYQDFEVIIIDDSSDDNGASRKVIDKYRNNSHVRHIIYNEQNSGSPFIQWKKGFSLAKGEYIWIAESDDFCDVRLLERLMECKEQYPDCAIIQTTSCYVDSDGRPLAHDWKAKGGIEYLDGKSFIKKHFIYSNLYIPNASAVVFRKDYAMGIPDDYMNYKASGDRLFWIYLCEKGGVCTLDLQWNYFRQHQNKVSSQKEIDGTQCRENFRINQYLREQGYVKGFCKMEEFCYYWKYIESFEFKSEEIRDELKRLWFQSDKTSIWRYRVYSVLLMIRYGTKILLNHS